MDSCIDQFSQRRDNITTIDPFPSFNHITVSSLHEDGSSEGELTVTPDSLNPHGCVHGGCLCTLADTVAGWGVASFQKKSCVTVSTSLNYLRPALGSNQKIRCRATPRKIGRTLCVYEVSLTDDAGTEVVSGELTFFLS